MGKFSTGLLVAAAGAALAAGGAQAQSVGDDAFAQTCAAAAHSSANGGPWDPTALNICTKSIETEALGDKAMASTHVNRGILRAAVKDYVWAITDFDQAIGLEPRMAEAYLNRAWARIALKQYAKALPDIDKALALGPKDPARAYYNRGIVHEELGDAKAAYLDYRMASQLRPDWDSPKQELARFKVVK